MLKHLDIEASYLDGVDGGFIIETDGACAAGAIMDMSWLYDEYDVDISRDRIKCNRKVLGDGKHKQMLVTIINGNTVSTVLEDITGLISDSILEAGELLVERAWLLDLNNNS
jgi:hypothetical protein